MEHVEIEHIISSYSHTRQINIVVNKGSKILHGKSRY